MNKKRCSSSSDSRRSKKQQQHLTATSTADDDLITWLKASGTKGLDRLQFRTSEVGSLGCFAHDDFNVGDLLFAIPCKCMITITDANQSDLIALIRQGVSALQLSGALKSPPASMTAELLLWVFLIEQLHAADSTFGSFMRSLDTVSPSPLSWPGDLLEALHATNMDMAVSTDALMHQCALLEEVRIWGEQNRKDVTLLQPETMNASALCWARGHYLSRRYPAHFGGVKGSSIGLPGEAREDGMENLGTLVPLLDILNHSDEHDYLTFTVNDGYLNVLCNYPRKKGDELLSNYGKLSNEKLLFAYGFSIENNIHDAIALKPMCRGPKGEANNLGMFYVGCGGMEAVPPELWRALSSLIPDDAPVESSDNEQRETSLAPSEHQPVEVGMDEVEILHGFIEKKLNLLEASQERAEGVLARYEGDPRAGWIGRYRGGQLELLRELCTSLADALDEAEEGDEEVEGEVEEGDEEEEGEVEEGDEYGEDGEDDDGGGTGGDNEGQA